MKKIVSAAMIFVMLFSNIHVYAQSVESKNGSDRVEGAIGEDVKSDSFIVKYKKTNRSSLLRAGNLSAQNKEQVSNKTEVIDFDEEMTVSEVDELLNDSNIEYIQPNYYLSLESMDNGDSLDSGELTENEQGNVTVGGDRDVLVAVIDSAVDTENNEICDSISNNGHCFVDGIDELDEGDLKLEQSHGTHIAGIIAGKSSVTDDIECDKIKIMPLTVFKNGQARTSDVIEAIEYAKDNNADIVNLSFGGSEYNPALEEAIESAPEILFVCAAGNYRRNVDEQPIYPAGFDAENILSVTSCNNDGGMSYYSNYGSSVDIAAIGKFVESTISGGERATMSGTSMSAAVVTRAAALVLSQNDNYSTENIKDKILDGSDKISPLSGYVKDSARMNVNNALLGIVKTGVVSISAEDEFSLKSELMNENEAMTLFNAVETIQISAGAYHSLALKSDGSVWAWGDNENGQLGTGNNIDQHTPVQVQGLTGIIKVEAGGNHSMALKSDGTIWSWGDNGFGQLGIGSFTSRNIPVQITSITGSDISLGYDHSIVRAGWSIYTFGSNQFGQLGNASFGTERATPGRPTGFGDGTVDDIYDIVAGKHNSFAIGANDRVLQTRNYLDYWGWGDGINATRPVQIGHYTEIEYLDYSYSNEDDSFRFHLDAGLDQAFINWDNNTFKAFGKNQHGELTLSDLSIEYDKFMDISPMNSLKRLIPGDKYTMGLTNSGDVYLWGNIFYSDENLNNMILDVPNTTIPIKIDVDDIAQVSAGEDYVLFLDEDGVVWSLGKNGSGQLGIGNTQGVNVPMRVFGFTSDNDVIVSDVSAGKGHSLAVKANGTVWAWGDNTYGQLGDGTTAHSNIPVQVRTLTDVVAVSAGDGFSLALKSNGEVYSWGRNNRGQLGLGDIVDRKLPVKVDLDATIKKISAGGRHVMALDSSKNSWIWGANDKGQLGDRTYVDNPVPRKITELTYIADVQAGKSHSVLLKQNSAMYTWGDNSYGQLGISRAINQQYKPITLTTGINKISAGGDITLAIKSDSTVWACGYNVNGELALGNTNNPTYLTQIPGLSNINMIEAGSDFCFAKDGDNNILYWGNKEYDWYMGGASYANNTHVVKAYIGDMSVISAGHDHVLFMNGDDVLYSYGANQYGQLGNEKYTSYGTFDTVTWYRKPIGTPSNGAGTSTNPYLIYNKDDLYKINGNLEAYYKLMNNIDLDGHYIEPIGTARVPFSGWFDGNGYKITNLNIDMPMCDNVGLFGYVEGGLVKNVYISNSEVVGRNNVGVIIGYLYDGTLRDCTGMFVYSYCSEGASALVGYIDDSASLINNIVSNEVWNISTHNKTESIVANKVYEYMLTVSNIPYVGDSTYVVNYDPAKLQLTAVGINVKGRTGNNVVKDNDIEIISNSNGVLKFKVNRNDKNWSGVLTAVTFKGKANGSATVSFNVERG